MNMVRHQAVGVDLDAKGILQLAQVSQVSLAIFVSGEYDLTVVASLDDMVWVVRQNKTAHPGHSGALHSVERRQISGDARIGVQRISRKGLGNKSVPFSLLFLCGYYRAVSDAMVPQAAEALLDVA